MATGDNKGTKGITKRAKRRNRVLALSSKRAAAHLEPQVSFYFYHSTNTLFTARLCKATMTTSTNTTHNSLPQPRQLALRNG